MHRLRQGIHCQPVSQRKDYRGDHVEAEVVDSSPLSTKALNFGIYSMSMDGPINVARLLHLCSSSIAFSGAVPDDGDLLHGSQEPLGRSWQPKRS